MKLLILPPLVLLGSCQFATKDNDEEPACLEERFDMTRDERRRGFLLSQDMENIAFGRSYTRAELVARYRLFRGDRNRLVPTSKDLSVAKELVLKRSDGKHDPDQVLTATPCMYIEVIPKQT